MTQQGHEQQRLHQQGHLLVWAAIWQEIPIPVLQMERHHERAGQGRRDGNQ